MMRIRSIKPEFWRSKTIAGLAWDVRFVLKGLESYVDDNGVGKDDIALIAADVFPRDLSANPRETLARLSEAISTLAEAGLVIRYEADGDELIYIDRWEDIQRIDKPSKGRFRRPDGTLNYSETAARETLASPPETLAPVTGEQGNRGTEKRPPSTAAQSTEQDDPDFAKFWDVYPRKVGKGEARKAWAKLLKAGIDPADIIAGAERYRDDPLRKRQEIKYTKHPGPWLNAERWTDETSAAGSGELQGWWST